jgi:hypothetical protein
MIQLQGDWKINEWFDWLESQDLKIGQDWRWAWSDCNWAIEFVDPRIETMIRLKTQDTDLWSTPK